MRIGQHETQQANGSLLEKTWFQALMVAVVVLLGVGVWWISSHQNQISRWINPDKPAPAEKPVIAKPTVQ
ncbi:hypothetical protein FJZ36_05515 [Candidatus Poribacteria bacterium]|nr:hypothetical protein [Candidatus Poribacteria bacterium]